MSEAITIARPYAQAVFEQAQKMSDLKGWSDVLLSLAEAVSHAEVSSVISNPCVSKTQIASLMSGLLGQQANQQQQNFVRALVDNQRLQVLPEIALIFETLRAEAEKTVSVEVDSAYELSAEQKDKIVRSLKSRFNSDIKLVCNVNKELLGGIVIRAGDKVLDGSARTRLADMATALAR